MVSLPTCRPAPTRTAPRAASPVVVYLQLDPAGVGQHRLPAVAVAAVGAVAPGQVVVHLGVQRPFGQGLLQLFEKAVRIEGRLRIGAGQQLVEQDVGGFCQRSRQQVSPVLS